MAMFKPTPTLQKSSARLLGQRGPAVRILRRYLAKANRKAVVPSLVAPQTGLSAVAAWKAQGIPLQSLFPETTAKDSKELASFQRDESSESAHSMYAYADLETASRQARAAKDLANAPAIAAKKARRIKVPLASQDRARDLIPPGWQRPTELQWTSNIYSYNKQALAMIPATAQNTRHMIKLYFNMIPRNRQHVLGDRLTSPKYLLKSTFRAFVGDRMNSKQPVDFDIMSRVQPKQKRKGGFHYPLRLLTAQLPNITFQHTPGKVDISTFVYDRRIAVIKYRMKALGQRLQRILGLTQQEGWLAFGQNCSSWQRWAGSQSRERDK